MLSISPSPEGTTLDSKGRVNILGKQSEVNIILGAPSLICWFPNKKYELHAERFCKRLCTNHFRSALEDQKLPNFSIKFQIFAPIFSQTMLHRHAMFGSSATDSDKTVLMQQCHASCFTKQKCVNAQKNTLSTVFLNTCLHRRAELCFGVFLQT